MLSAPPLSPNEALLLAAEKGDKQAILNAIENGANIEATREGRTSLMIATKSGHISAISLLLQHNANREARDDKGRTSLMIAAKNGNIPAIRALLGNNDAELGWGAVEYPDGKLEYDNAAVESPDDKLEYDDAELGYGADINASDNSGMTPLMIAMKYADIDTITELLKHEPEDKADANGMTALMYAACREDSTAIEELCCWHKEEIRTMAQATGKNGQTALMLAIINGNEVGVKALLPHSDVNATNKLGMTALMLTLSLLDDEQAARIATMLLQHGAKHDITNKFGETALTLATCHNGLFRQKVATALLQYGALYPPAFLEQLEQMPMPLDMQKPLRKIAFISLDDQFNLNKVLAEKVREISPNDLPEKLSNLMGDYAKPELSDALAGSQDFLPQLTAEALRRADTPGVRKPGPAQKSAGNKENAGSKKRRV